MDLTAEISMYPLRDDFIPPIEAVIRKLNTFTDIEVNTNATATILTGEFHAVMDAIRDTLVWSQAEYGTAVFVTKLIPGYLPD